MMKDDFGTILENAAIILDENLNSAQVYFDRVNTSINNPDESVVCNLRSISIKDYALIQMSVRISDLESELAILRKEL